MLRNIKDLIGYSIRSTDDDDIGSVHDVYFDDDSWTVRYIVVDTGGWLDNHKVLVAPEALDDPDWYSQSVTVRMTRKQIEKSPDIDTAKPISRQQELDYRGYFGWTPYWGIGLTPAPVPVPPPDTGAAQVSPAAVKDREEGDPHLRSAREVMGYHIRATDGEIGHVEDFVADTDAWSIRYMIVDTRNWLPGKHVVVSPAWIEQIDFASGEVQVDVTKERIESAPEFDPSAPVNRAYEERLYDYYGRPAYWS